MHSNSNRKGGGGAANLGNSQYPSISGLSGLSAQQTAQELLDQSIANAAAQTNSQASYSSQQRKAQRQSEIYAEIEKAAKEANSEVLQNIIEEDGQEDNGSSGGKLITKRELNKALLIVVQNANASKEDQVNECINILLQQDANIDTADPQEGKTALMIACEKGYIRIVEYLTDEDAQVNHKDTKQKTPILHALDAPGENFDVVDRLIKKGADINQVSIDGWSPLLKATAKKYHSIMHLLLTNGSNPKQRQQQSQNTALHIACENGDLEGVQVLIKHHNQMAELLESQNREKETPIQIAQRHLASLPNTDERTQEYTEIISFLTNVLEDREQKAQKAKEELVKQEEINEEKEKKKIKNKQQQLSKQYAQSRGTTVGQQAQVKAQENLSKNQATEQQDQNKDHANEEEKKNVSSKKDAPTLQDDEYFTAQPPVGTGEPTANLIYDQIQANAFLTGGVTPLSPPYQMTDTHNLQQQNISNPLSNEILGHSPILESALPPNINPQQLQQEFINQLMATHLNLNNAANIANTNQQQQQEQWMLQQKMNLPPQHQLKNQSPTKNTGGVLNQTNSSGKKQQHISGAASGSSSQQQYSIPGGRNLHSGSGSKPAGQGNNFSNQGQNVSNFNNQLPQANFENSGMNTPQQQQRKSAGYHQQNQTQSNNNSNQGNVNTAGGNIKQNKTLPFPNNSVQQQQNQHSHEISPQHQTPQTINRQASNQNTQTAQLQQQAAAQMQLFQQVVGAQQMQGPGATPQLLIPQPGSQQGAPTLPGMLAIGALGNQPTLMFPFGQPSGFPAFPLSNLNQFQAPNPQSTQQQSLLNLATQQVNAPPQTQQLQQSRSSHQQNSRISQQPQQSSPITDELDLSEPQALSSFIMDQQLYYAQKRLEEKDREYSVLQMKYNETCTQFQILEGQLQNADFEINQLRHHKLKNEGELKHLEQVINQMKHDHRQELDSASRQFAYEASKLKESNLEMERLLMKIHSVQQQTTDLIVRCYEEKRLFTENEVQDVKSILSGSQLKLNQLIVSSHTQEFIPASRMGTMPQPPVSQQQIVNQSSFQHQASSSGSSFHSTMSGIQSQLSQHQLQAAVASQPKTAIQTAHRHQLSMQTNRLIHMIERFESPSQDQIIQDQNDVYNKLHLEILQFRDSVREILNEMQPLKEQLIENISAVIKRALPHSEVKVYGSHATKLCLPWSDIDLVIIAPPQPQQVKGSSSVNMMMMDNPKSVLGKICQELQNEQQNKWVTDANFVDNATVPVVKVKCHIKDLLIQQTSTFSNQEYEKYRIFLDQPFNIDITQMTDHHNGLECVRLVQDFLSENEIIEPLILVLKQLLKACQLNNPYYGGLSSYALFLMITAFLQSQDISRELSKVNLGRTLINFLGFYGNFDHEQVGISCHLPLCRQQNPNEMKPNHYSILNFMMIQNPCVQIDDPLNNHNNVGKSSFKFYEIKGAFDYAQRVFFLGCFCDCHNHLPLLPDAALFTTSSADSSTLGMAIGGSSTQLMVQGGSRGVTSASDVVSQKRQCDSVLSRIIYSYKMFDNFFGPTHSMQ